MLAVVVLACSKEIDYTPASVPPEAEALYDMIHRYRHDYERGLERILAGDGAAGENLLSAATDRLRVAAELCAEAPECDPRLFVDSLGHVHDDRVRSILSGTLVPSPPAPAGDDDGPRAELAGRDLREIIPRNDRVRAALNDWLTWSRPDLQEAWENYQYLRHKIAPIYEEAGLPEALLFAIMAKETGGKVHAYSRSGAAGPLQFMPQTARRYGLGSVDGFDMRLDPVAATKANVRWLEHELRAFGNNLEKTLAAYNVGETRVRRLHRTHRGAEFWDPVIYYSLPRETRKYVPQVLAAMLLFLSPADYGLEFPEIEAGTTTITLAEPLSLGELTICLGQEGNPSGWFRTLRNLNPRVRPSKRLPADATLELPSKLVPVYAELCVGEPELVLAARALHDAGYPERPATSHYTVRRGDTLAKIAARQTCWSVRKLAQLNGIDAPGYVVHVGQRLTVPRCG